jgi:hypothetical protein
LKPLKEASWYGGVETPPFHPAAESYFVAFECGAKERDISLAGAVDCAFTMCKKKQQGRLRG